MLSRVGFVAAVIASIAVSAAAQSPRTIFNRPCIATGDVANCAPFYGCIKSTDGSSIFLFGRADGYNHGGLEAELATGARCVGSWRRTGRSGVAEATCDDGRTYSSTLTARDRPTGTAISQGETNLGEPVVVWTGFNAPSYIEGGAVTGWARACGLDGLTS